MRFYQKPHEFYCGIDLHTRKMYCCLVDAAGNKLVHRNLDTRGGRFHQASAEDFSAAAALRPRANLTGRADSICDSGS